MAKVLPAITIRGVCYTVLRLAGPRGPWMLLRSPAGDLFGLFPEYGPGSAMKAAPLERASGFPNPLEGLEFRYGDGKLEIEGG